jgi:hypothetical protein
MFRLDDMNGVQYPVEVFKEFIPEDTRPAFPQSPQIHLSRIREPVKKTREILEKWVTYYVQRNEREIQVQCTY